MSLRAGLAVSNAIAGIAPGERLRLKWPNDLMLGERKAGGLLCEARWQGSAPAWVVIGLGLNVANPPDAALASTATHLAARRPGLAPAELIEPMVAALRGVDAGAGPLTAREQDRFARRDWLRGRALEHPVAGIAEGVSLDGALRVRMGEGRLVQLRTGTVVPAEGGAAPVPP
jgi:BirA family biotin operon repressor/biotin-[acetyl-CoA-carboxylase] ligase